MPRTRLSMLLAVILASGVLGVSPGSVLAAAESDIPGVPLPGPVVSGQLGGPIYDVVYRVEIPAGSVLVISLTGSPGTDFDLYLFSSSATTVVNLEGLIAKSIGPTSTESLSFATQIASTFYIDLNGATDVQGTYTLAVQIVPDPTAPQVSILLADAAPATNDPTVGVTLGAFEDLSGVSEMSLSEDGVTFGPWEPLRSSFTWTFAQPDGTMSLYARVRNGVGLVSAPARDSILLDRASPTVSAITPAPNSIVSDAQPVVRVQFSEAIRPETWVSDGVVMQAATGARVGGSLAYDAGTRTGSFRPAQPLELGMSYILTVGPVLDLAGNTVTQPGSWTLKALRATSVSLVPSATVLVWGQSVRLSGRASLPPGGVVTLLRRDAAIVDYVPVAEVTPSSGSFSHTIRPARSGWYRATFPGTGTAFPAGSAEQRILVRRRIALVGASAQGTSTGVAGRIVTLTAVARPERPGLQVSFLLYRYDRTSGRYRLAASYGRVTDETGRATLRWRPRPGEWAWRVSITGDTEYANNITPFYRWRIG